ncbi:hypothetical protein FQR65_LT19882 [Abscondita terminalis]|nr:hypothetical protein FQR65_LT19882 [Abscondita terminalis]
MEDRNLIRLVERNSLLYDKRSGNYKRTDLKLKIWKKISEELGYEDLEKAPKRWKFLRDKYVKQKRKMLNKPSGSSYEDDETWSLMGDLSFLEPYLQQRTHYTNVNVVSEQYTDIEFVDADVSVDAEQDNESSASTSNVASSSSAAMENTPTNKRRQKSPVLNNIDKAIANISDHFANKSNNTDVAFCNYLASEMATINKKRKKQLKQMIINFITTNSDSED